MVAAIGSGKTRQLMEGKVREREERGEMAARRGAQRSWCHQQNRWE
jgi:hypothetical protein